jgi:hypothetical protein
MYRKMIPQPTQPKIKSLKSPFSTRKDYMNTHKNLFLIKTSFADVKDCMKTFQMLDQLRRKNITVNCLSTKE